MSGTGEIQNATGETEEIVTGRRDRNSGEEDVGSQGIYGTVVSFDGET